MKTKGITWSSKKVKANVINPTPGNYKIENKIGMQRLATSLNKFGRAGTVVCNPSTKPGRYDLIDGNSRWKGVVERNPNEVMEISVPSRRLTPAEYKEMAAMFDYAVAGEVDTERIHKDLGNTLEWFKQWGIEPPMEQLEKMGKNANLEELEYPDDKAAGKDDKKGNPANLVNDIMTVQLILSSKQEEEFRKWEDKAKKKFKTDNTTDTVLKALKSVKL